MMTTAPSCHSQWLCVTECVGFVTFHSTTVEYFVKENETNLTASISGITFHLSAKILYYNFTVNFI